jgi:hypothetical protein
MWPWLGPYLRGRSLALRSANFSPEEIENHELYVHVFNVWRRSGGVLTQMRGEHLVAILGCFNANASLFIDQVTAI